MFTCLDHSYAVVTEKHMLFLHVYIICINEDCDYEYYVGRSMRWRE